LIADAELVAPSAAQAAIGNNSDRQFLGLIGRVPPGWLPHLPDQSQYNRRLPGLFELISIVQQRLARWLDRGGLCLSDGTLIGVANYPGCQRGVAISANRTRWSCRQPYGVQGQQSSSASIAAASLRLASSAMLTRSRPCERSTTLLLREGVGRARRSGAACRTKRANANSGERDRQRVYRGSHNFIRVAARLRRGGARHVPRLHECMCPCA
jgi:hypothetical protein